MSEAGTNQRTGREPATVLIAMWSARHQLRTIEGEPDEPVDPGEGLEHGGAGATA